MSTSIVSELNKIIDKYRFKTFPKLIHVIRQDARFANLSNKDIKNIIANRIHDKKPNREYKKIYQVKVFSRFRNAYFTDLYDNLEGNEPRYWQIFINTNTRYTIAYPLQDKTKESIHENLVEFVNEFHPRKITSDEESGLLSKMNIDYLKDNKCGLFIVTEKKHSSLSIIDRLIRTLRDMNTPQEKPYTDQSHQKQFTFISPSKMDKLLHAYNNTIHNSTGHTPKEMMDNPQLEDEYIEKCISEETKQMALKDFKLKEGDLVRYIIQYNPHSKKRSVVSRETYKIEGVRGNIYTIIAQDGTTKDLPRWRLIRVNNLENKRMGTSLGTNKGVVEKVIKEVSPSKVKVSFVMPNGSKYEDTINKTELRLPFPQFKSGLEL